MKIYIHTLLLSLLLTPLAATNLSVDAIEWQDLRGTNGGIFVQFNLRWDNAWYNERNHDAAWIFVKLIAPDGNTRHLKVLGTGHELANNHLAGTTAPAFTVPTDRSGIFIAPAQKHRGKVAWKIRVALDPEFATGRSGGSLWTSRMEVFGIEMVKINSGEFTIGDPDTTALAFGAFYRSGGEKQFDGLVKISSETAEIQVGPAKGQLCYRNNDPDYQGDMNGPVPAACPKGVKGFYIMKYELTQGQYAAFLNTLTDEQTNARVNTGGREYYKTRGTITLKGDRYVAEKPDRPCNFISWDDACAYSDWAALRPMTELEFEKACRGSNPPLPHEYAWNTGSKNKLAHYVNDEGDLVWETGIDESQMTDANREMFGASYFWVFDLSGGALWERCITIGSPEGRTFTGTHGDGRINYYGFADNADWPKGSTEGSGWGFRGGGYYYNRRMYGEFNPHSPIAYRRFGAWGGGAREPAYGSRFVRTSED